MKKILLSLITILAVAGIVVGATQAQFDDSANMTGITFSTGNADLQMTQMIMHNWYPGDATAAELGVTFPTNLYPGFENTWNNRAGTIYLGNFSKSAIGLNVHAKINNYSETIAGLRDVLYLKMAWSGDDTGTGWHTLSWWTTNSAPLFAGVLPNDHSGGYGGYAKFVAFEMKMDSAADDGFMNGDIGFNIHFDAIQAPLPTP